jgi:hypothetical protein
MVVRSMRRGNGSQNRSRWNKRYGTALKESGFAGIRSSVSTAELSSNKEPNHLVSMVGLIGWLELKDKI